MTAQIEDRCRYQDREYQIAAVRGDLLFTPWQYDIMPQQASTACDCGFWCKYGILGDKLRLEDLFVNSRDGNYPAIEGVLPAEETYMGHHLYKGVNIPMDFTGKMMLGDGFLDEYYDHMGHQSPWTYKTLLEVTFENGKVVSVSDHSQIAYGIRQALEKDLKFLTKLRTYQKRQLNGQQSPTWWL